MLKKFLVPIVIFVVIIGLGSGIYISTLWNTPLGPALDLPTQVSEQVVISSNSETIDLPVSKALTQATPTAQSLINQIISIIKPRKSANNLLCDGPATMTILLIGSDERSNDYLYGLADSIRAIRVDFINPGVMMLDIPRDLWVEIPGISDHYGITHGKVNQAYFFGNPGMGYYDGPGAGPGLLARTLDHNFGLQVEHYLAVDLTTFVNFIDSIGGLDVTLGNTIDLNKGSSLYDPDLVLEAGPHHLDGEVTLRLATNRFPTTFQRARFQDIILKSLREKLLSPAMIPELPGMISQFSQSVQTDLSLNEINKLLCIAQAVSSENIQMLQFPESMFTSQRTYDPYRNVNTFTLGADFNQIRTYFEEFKNGTWPSP